MLIAASVGPASVSAQPRAGAPDLPCVAIPVIDGKCEAWTAQYDTNGDPDALPRVYGVPDLPVAVAASPTGDRLFVTGWSGYLLKNKLEWLTVAYDQQTGEELWVVRMHDDSPDNPDATWGMAVSPDGETVYVSGGRGLLGPARGDIFTVAYDAATGEVRWRAAHESPHGRMAMGTGITLSQDGSRFYVTGFRAFPAGSETQGESVLVAYDAHSGEELWAVARPGWEYSEVDVSPDGSRVVALNYDSGSVTVYDTEEGTELWAVNFGLGTEGERIRGSALVVGDGRAYVTGKSLRANPNGGDFADFLTIAYDVDTGERLWSDTYGPSGRYNAPTAMALAPDGGRLYVTGEVTGDVEKLVTDLQKNVSTSESRFGTVAYDPSSGELLWDHQTGQVVPWYPATPTSIAVAPDGQRVYVSGHSTRTGAWDAATVAYEGGSGAVAWRAHYNPDGRSNVFGVADYGIAISPDGGRVFVLNQINPGSGYFDYGVQAYDA